MPKHFPTFGKLGLATDSAEVAQIVVSGHGFIQSDNPAGSLVPCHRITVTDLETLKDLCGSPIPSLKDNTHKNGTIAGLVATYLNGHRPLTDKERSFLSEMVLPVSVSVADAEDITIKAGSVLTLGEPDGRPASYDFKKITLEEGGRIEVISPVTVNATSFEKVVPK
ncbi:hypothetical protein SAMN05444141_11334 [Pseudovibrio denitrificans]|uniref:Uncharacterized protein n=1 Tax=Pseudovibrio denitrificans TaxID=258256 RepID=A0A1I7DYQ9_9HYPH|nr:hypothetical protein [Pseudovibrio denitrificans]SFU16801.1 hypothetical protein SAMN05444141_11334 [Pseudovibrio denitrificans]